MKTEENRKEEKRRRGEEKRRRGEEREEREKRRVFVVIHLRVDKWLPKYVSLSCVCDAVL